MIKITFLGTSSMLPTKERNHNAVFIKYKNEGLLVDCGEGTQRQFRLADIPTTKVTKLLITHFHGDHVLGILGLIQSLGANNYKNKLEIYGPKNTKHYIKNMLSSIIFKNKIRMEITEITKSGIFFENKDFILESAQLEHSIYCLGYSFIEKDTRNVNVIYTKKFGLTRHPLLGNLQKGKNITYMGQKIEADKATTIKKGKKITIILDTLPTKNAVTLAKDSDILIADSTWSYKQEKASGEHLTNMDAANLAKDSNSKKLILTHFSQRYKNVDDLKEEIKDVFKETITAKDLMEIEI